MKKRFAFILLMCVFLFAACGSEAVWRNAREEPRESVVLEVVTTFAGNDGSAQYYLEACENWVKESGNTLVDMSTLSDEVFKTRVITDFETGSEPDVLFFFIGADANNFIEAGKVVSMEEIQESYPDFGSNLDVEKIPVSLVDGKVYALPVNSYWEALFVNRTVLEAAGVSMPGENYTWKQFLEDCAKIKKAGYIPIAASMGNIPHYWWEYAIFNHTGTREHQRIPSSVEEPLGQAWVQGMEDIKQLYELGFFPSNTNTVSDEQTVSMFIEGKAAFLLDGSWKVGSIVQGCYKYVGQPESLDEEKLAQFDITFVPGTESRRCTDIIGGTSMGYYITRKAWDDPAKRDAAVSFVSYMTSDEIIPQFAGHTVSALKNPPQMDDTTFNSLQLKAMEMLSESTSMTSAVQDLFQGECRVPTFDGMPNIVTGRVEAEKSVMEGLYIYNTQ